MTTTNFELPILYHGTDLRYVNFPENLRKNYHQYCYYLREVLYAHFSQYHNLNDKDYSRLEEFMGDCIDKDPKMFELLKEGMTNVLLSKVSEEFEYGSLYLTSSIHSAFLYAEKAYAGGEFAFAAYALAKAAKAKGLEDWYLNEELPTMGQFVDILIKVAEETPQPVIYKITNIDPLDLRTEGNESIEIYMQNGKLTETEFRCLKPITLSDYEYIIVDNEFIEKLKTI